MEPAVEHASDEALDVYVLDPLASAERAQVVADNFELAEWDL